MLALDTILRDGRTSISEMYNELKIFINDANPINIATDDFNITTNDDINITTDTDVQTSTSIIDTSITNDDINITTDTDVQTSTSIIDTSITNDDINITTDTNIHTSTSIIDTSITNDDINITTDTDIVDTYLLALEDVGVEQNAVDDKIDNINVKSSNNDSSSGNNLIIQRLRLLFKWLANAVKNFAKGQTVCSSRYAYVILCGISSSFLDHYNDTKILFEQDTNDVDESKDILESYLYQLLKYSVSKKKQSLREKDYQQIEKYINRFEKKEMFTAQKLNKWRDRLQQNDIAQNAISKNSEVTKKSKKHFEKKHFEIDNEIINKYNPVRHNISDYDYFKTCEILNVLCHELKVLLDIELTAFEVLNRICLQLLISSNEIAFAAVASLLLSGKICSTHHHHVGLNKILYTYWKYIGDLDASADYSNQNKQKKNLALKVALPKDKDKMFFFTECIRFEKLALIALEFDMDINPPTVIGGALEKFVDAANLQSAAQQLIKLELGQPNYKFSGLSLTVDPLVAVAALYQNVCIKSKDKSGSSKIVDLACSLMLRKEEIDEVNSFLRMQKVILNTKFNQLESEAAIINLDATTCKLGNNDGSGSSDNNPNPFLMGNMDIEFKGNNEVNKIINDKKNSIIDTNAMTTNKDRTSSISPYSRERIPNDGNGSVKAIFHERNRTRKRSRSRSRSRKRTRDGDYGHSDDYSRYGDYPRYGDYLRYGDYGRYDNKEHYRGQEQKRRSRSNSRDQQHRIFVYRLSDDISADDLTTLFSKFGKVISVDMKSNTHGNKFAFVDFDSASSMNAALLPISAPSLVIRTQRLKVDVANRPSR